MEKGMSVQPKTQRGVILDGIKQKLINLNLSWGNPFRKIERKAWTPGETMLPSIVVNDDGVTKGNDKSQSDTTKVMLLKFQVILNLAIDFGNEGAVLDVTDIVEQIRLNVQNFNPKAGVLSMDVLSDTPVDVEFGGVSTHIWIIDCECEYFVEVRAFA